MRAVLPRIEEHEARRRTRTGVLRRLLGAECPLRLELVYLPHHRLDFVLDGGDEIAALLDATGGAFSMLPSPSSLPADLPRVADRALLPARIDEATAESRIREELSEAARRHARRSGSRRSASLRLLRHERVAFPYWVQYVRRRAGVDFRAIDGLSGDPAGVRLRRSIALGIVEAQSQKRSTSPL